MRAIIALTLKELMIRKRYRVVWVNFALTPFFTIAPYVLSANAFSGKELAESILFGTLIWYWFGQFMFGVGDAFSEEREEGCFVSIVLSPLGLIGFLAAKALDVIIMNAFITLFTTLLFSLFSIHIPVWQIVVFFIVSGICIFMYSLGFAGMNLFLRRTEIVGSAAQYLTGILSGMTVDVRKFPLYVKLASYVIPLTFIINGARKAFNQPLSIWIIDVLLALSISTLYMLLGLWLLKKAEYEMRKRGEWETW